jgi:hypothetical protein
MHVMEGGDMARKRPLEATEEAKNLEHALVHLKANKIHDKEHFKKYGGGGWYQGNKTEFVNRHVKAIEFLTSLLKGGRILRLKRQAVAAKYRKSPNEKVKKLRRAK